MKRTIISQLILITTIIATTICRSIAQTPFNPFDWRLAYDNGYYDDNYSWGCYAGVGITYQNQPASSALLSTHELVVAGKISVNDYYSNMCYTKLEVSKFNSQGQVVATYRSGNTDFGSEWTAKQLVATINDNIYVLGTNPTGHIFIKLNSSLVEQWRVRVNTLGEIFIATDNSGNLIAAFDKSDSTAASGRKIVVKKLSSVNGVDVTGFWFKDQPDANIGTLNDLKVDQNNNIYICGAVTSGIYGNRFFTAKLNSNFVLEWRKYYDGQSTYSDDAADAIVIDHNQDIIVTGQTYLTGSGYDVVTIKYNSDGIKQWVKRRDFNQMNDNGHLIRVDNSNNVYVCAQTLTGNYNHEAITNLLKYDPNGNIVFKRSIEGLVNYDLAISGLGNCYIAGKIFYKYDPYLSGDYVQSIYKINNQGAIVWYANDSNDVSVNMTGCESKNIAVHVNDITGEVWLTGAEFRNFQLETNYNWTIDHIVPGLRIEREAINSNVVYLTPNPVSDILYLGFNRDIKNAEVSILDLEGREVFHLLVQGNFETINVTGLTHGIYVARLIYDGNVVNKKFVKE